MVKLFLLIGALLFWAIPLFSVRVTLICLVFVFLINHYKRIPRPIVFAFLLSIYTFAFILSPYWNAPKPLEWKIISLAVLLLIIPVLSFYSANTIRLDSFTPEESFGHPRGGFVALLILTGLLYALNYIPLKVDIPWRGDEDYHMSFILDMWLRVANFSQWFAGFVQTHWQTGIVLLLILLALIFVIKRRALGPPAGGSFTSPTLFSDNTKFVYLISLFFYVLLAFFSFYLIARFSQGFSSNFATHYTLQVLRYPNLQKWLEFFLIYPSFYSDVALYRMVPFTSTLLLSWFLYLKFRKMTGPTLSVIYSLLFVLVPLLFYYSSLLYLEMPAILLMTICIFGLEVILTAEFTDLLKSPIWYALWLIPFLKETSLFFLLIVLGARSVYQIFISRGGIKALFLEGKLWLLVLSPLIIYLFFRSLFADFQGHTWQLSKLFSATYYLVEIKALWEQLGLFLILALVGLVMLTFKRKWFLSTVLTLLSVSQVLLTIGDSKGVLSYVGYSRWNLLLMPILLFTAYYALTKIKKRAQVALAIGLFASNLYFVPFHLDGTRVPNWGSPMVDTGEYTYPYERAVQWLKQEGKTRNLLIAGFYYHYDGVRFYFNKYQFLPKVQEYFFGSERFTRERELNLLEKLFKDMEANNTDSAITSADKILYHSVNNIDLDGKKVYDGKYKIERKISNTEHTIYIFSKEE